MDRSKNLEGIFKELEKDPSALRQCWVDPETGEVPTNAPNEGYKGGSVVGGVGMTIRTGIEISEIEYFRD